MYTDNLSLFFSFFSLHWAYTCIIPVCTHNATTQAQAQENGNCSILLCLCSCLRRCMVHVNRDNASIKHKVLMLASHQFARRFLVLVLMLKVVCRTCKPSFSLRKYGNRVRLQCNIILQPSTASPVC